MVTLRKEQSIVGWTEGHTRNIYVLPTTAHSFLPVPDLPSIDLHQHTLLNFVSL